MTGLDPDARLLPCVPAGKFAGENERFLRMALDWLLECGEKATDETLVRWTALGFRLGNRGTHTSRTIMLDELHSTLAECPADAPREGYAAKIIDENILGKRTTATRKLTNQRLGELYGLDPAVPLFRIMRHLWAADERGRPLLALLAALARDPLLRATAPPILELEPGRELLRSDMTNAVRKTVEDRLNDSILDKVVRNTSSSWVQSGHLAGRVRKIRQTVSPTPFVTVYVLLLAYCTGARGQTLFENPWARLLDTPAEELKHLAMDAKRIGLIDMKQSGGLLHVSFDRVFTEEERRLVHGTD